jgi:hypothetical protein
LLHNLNDSHGTDKKTKKTKAASAPSIQNSSGFKLHIAPAPKKSVLEILDTLDNAEHKGIYNRILRGLLSMESMEPHHNEFKIM